jgi:hypothetical protein
MRLSSVARAVAVVASIIGAAGLQADPGEQRFGRRHDQMITMRRAWIIGAIVLLIVIFPFVSLRVATVRAISRIEALQGRSGDFAEITRPIDTRYHSIESTQELERARVTMGLPTVSNLVVVRFTGEGLPYFYGFVAYDTNKQQVVRAVVDQLW